MPNTRVETDTTDLVAHPPAGRSPTPANEAERLRREHGELKARLTELNSRLYLSPAEELERKTIQKLKLQKKDRIAALMVNYSGSS